MPKKQDPVVRASKFLSFVLRHKPDEIGLNLDPEGWANIDELLQKAGNKLTMELLMRAVVENDKQRFALSSSGLLIKARQGHTIPVELGLEPTEPPDVLYHGTYAGGVAAIMSQGLSKMQRHHVHLTASYDLAVATGSRRGKPIILVVKAKELSKEQDFFVTDNGVWLTEKVPADPKFLVRAFDKPRDCPDCGAKPGFYHQGGCDVARCPDCGSQAITCSCGSEEPDTWSGFWPGELEASALGFWCYEDPPPGRDHGPFTSCGPEHARARADLNRYAVYKSRGVDPGPQIKGRYQGWN